MTTPNRQDWKDELREKFFIEGWSGYPHFRDNMGVKELEIFISEKLAQEKRKIVEEIRDNEDLNEYLRNPLHMSVRNELDKLLDSLCH